MTQPASLKPGDKVAIVATARRISPEELDPAIKLFQSWGLEVVIPDGLFATKGQLAGNDEHRAAVLQSMLDDGEIRAIFCARGGYGTVRIVDLIDWTKFALTPKWIVGYSDVTVLHSHINENLGISTLHATMPINITTESVLRWESIQALRTLHDTLFGTTCSIRLDCRRKHINPKDAEGEIVGGNLSILYSLCGSISDIDTDGKILLIEDLDEYLYHIDRMMQNLKRNGKLFGIKALIVGAMSNMQDNSIPFGMTAEEIILDAAKGADYPIFFTDQIGHVGMENKAIILGKNCRIGITSDQSIEIIY